LLEEVRREEGDRERVARREDEVDRRPSRGPQGRVVDEVDGGGREVRDARREDRAGEGRELDGRVGADRVGVVDLRTEITYQYEEQERRASRAREEDGAPARRQSPSAERRPARARRTRRRRRPHRGTPRARGTTASAGCSSFRLGPPRANPAARTRSARPGGGTAPSRRRGCRTPSSSPCPAPRPGRPARCAARPRKLERPTCRGGGKARARSARRRARGTSGRACARGTGACRAGRGSWERLLSTGGESVSWQRGRGRKEKEERTGRDGRVGVQRRVRRRRWKRAVVVKPIVRNPVQG